MASVTLWARLNMALAVRSHIFWARGLSTWYSAPGVLVEVRLPNHVRHPGLDHLEAIFLQVRLYVVVGAGMEIEQVFPTISTRGLGRVRS